MIGVSVADGLCAVLVQASAGGGSLLGGYEKAFVSGLGFAMLGVAYRLGGHWRIAIYPIVAMLGVCATAYFWLGSGQAGAVGLSDTPVAVYAAGVLAGASQVATVALMALALRVGPLSPVWCAANMNFIPTGIFGFLAYGDVLEAKGLLAAAVGVAAILCGGGQQGGGDTSGGATVAERVRGRYAYSALLVVVFIANSVAGMSVKWLGKEWGSEYTGQGGFFIAMYGTLALGAAIASFARRDRIPSVVKLAACGVMAAGGSMIGLLSIAACADLPTMPVFAVSALTSLLVASVISVVMFGERVTKAWVLMIVLSVVALLLTV